MQIFYITFCWDRRLLYDGYIIRRDNDKIYGCTDENVIIGDKKGVKEIQKVLNDYPEELREILEEDCLGEE